MPLNLSSFGCFTQPKVANSELKFGHTFTDHMLEIDWTRDGGWEAPMINPYGPLPIDPAASVLHYGMECFEGMKAYKDDSGTIRLFRPDMNMKRINRSMEKLGFPVRLMLAAGDAAGHRRGSGL
jgi:branched-chain amino acid aminotransferase